MLKYYVRLLLLVGAIIGILLLVERMLPRSYDFQTTITIKSPPEKIFEQINSLKNWPNWSKQFNVETIDGLEILYNGTDAGVGAAQTWTESRGQGKLWISESLANEKVVYISEFGNFPEMTSSLVLSRSSETETTVVWRSVGSLPTTPLFGLMRTVFATQMGHDYDRSLQALKELLE